MLDLDVKLGKAKAPFMYDSDAEMLKALQERGFQHEEAYIDHLVGSSPGLEVVSFQNGGSVSDTEIAMRKGADIIVQAPLSRGRWMGRADILRRTPSPSDLGDWAYEVVDTKLARETRAGTILQLCLYSDIVAGIQGQPPEYMYVVSPGIRDEEPFAEGKFRVHDYLAYYRLIRRRLESAVASGIAGQGPETYPEPVPQCDICRWWPECNRRRRRDDHLSFIAGLSTSQQREIQSWGVRTLEAFANEPLPLRRPKRGSGESYTHAREQARVQLEGRRRNSPCHELLPREPERGLARLPKPSPGDVFFDIEGDSFVGTQGFEYLFGWVVLDETGRPDYRSRWAFDAEARSSFRAGEKATFEAFVDEITDRWAAIPDMHVYHFAPYEPGALKRLMGRYATREDEIDRMLRAGLFVDLHAVTRQAVRASVERYSIKDLEQFYGLTRDVDLRTANDRRHKMEILLEANRPQEVTDEMLNVVQEYNRDDCVSTLRLRDWLEGLRAELTGQGEDIRRPDPQEGEPNEKVSERQERVNALMERLLEDVPPEQEDRSDEHQACWLLAHVLDWHRREAKSVWWEYFHLQDLDEEALLDERAGISGLRFVESVEGSGRTAIHRYEYPAQETAVVSGDSLRQIGGDRIGTVAEIDQAGRTIVVKKRRDAEERHPTAVFTFNEPINTDTLSEALLSLGEWVAEHGMDAPGARRAGRDLLMRRAPRLSHTPKTGRPLLAEGESVLDAARRLVLQLDDGLLAIQGPPGTGKTYTGARMVCELVRAGKRVGITANSHKVIRNLLDAAAAAAAEEGLDIRCIQKVSGKADNSEDGPIRETDSNGDVYDALDKGEAQVAAGSAWLWSRPEFFESVDVLFVDEAGQMSLANVLAIASSAKSVVLLGDPQQLEQPQQGSHPEGADASALEHLLEGRKVIPDDQGLFIGETWRLHPTICRFTSELFYEGRLRSRQGLDRQALAGTDYVDGAGLWFAPVEHEGNQNSSGEEADRVAELHSMLTSGGVSWTDMSGERKTLTNEDVLVVVPYNAHLAEIGRRLPRSARVGSVDRFQGQEAPVVIYSMATSSAEEAPRGMEFLFSLNRLNVATSRARCTTILVASPRLFETECRTPRQMQLANALCRYRELACTLRDTSE